MKFMLAGQEQTDEIAALIEEAKVFLKECGVDQWQDGYPGREDIAADIRARKGYVLMDGGKAAGYCCADFGGEPAYETLKGSWLDAEPYVVIHRMAVGNAYKGQGLAKRLFAEVEGLAASRGVRSIRVDTDEGNAVMRHIIDSLGFTYCGTIWFADSVKIAFQKLCRNG